MAPFTTLKGHSSPDKRERSDPRVFFDISINSKRARVVMELYTDVPHAENFRSVCTGERLSYKGSSFKNVGFGLKCQVGDFTAGNGIGGGSIDGANLADKNLKRKHTGAGILSMARAGPGSDGSEFIICTTKTELLDGKNVVFGKIIEGMDTVKKAGKTSKPLVVTNCGELS